MAQQVSQQEAVQAIYGYAADLMRNGQSNYQIEQKLMEQGLSKEVAQTVVRNLDMERNRQRHDAASRSMMIGGVVCLIGLAVTFFTYQAASGGGTYVVAYGAIFYGGFQFLKGAFFMMNE